MAADPIRALVVPAHGGPDVLQVQERPAPEPAPGQLLVEVAAAGVNFIDVYRRQGVYRTDPPFVLGTEFAGRVVAVGAGGTDVGVGDLAVGDLVATSDGTGAMATQAMVAGDRAVRVPDGLDPEIAAAAMLQGMTAHYLVTSTYPVQPGDDVLVHAAAGGVGQLLVQLAVARGARVVATVGSAAKADIARRLGAADVIRYDQIDGTDALAAAIREASGGGVQVAYDSVGRSTFDASMAALRRRGMLVLFGASSGPVPPVDPQRLNSGGSLFLTRPTLNDYLADTDELRWRAGEVLGSIADGRLRLEIGGRYPLERADQAFRDLEARKTVGKLLVLP